MGCIKNPKMGLYFIADLMDAGLRLYAESDYGLQNELSRLRLTLMAGVVWLRAGYSMGRA